MKKQEQQADNELVVIKEKISGMQAMVESTVVTNQDELNAVADKIKMVKVLGKAVETKKNKFTEPAKLIISEARQTYDPLLKECKDAETRLKMKASVYMVDQENKRKQDEERIAARVEKGTMKIETATKKIENLPEVQNTVRTDNGSGLRLAKRKVAKIADPNLIPDEFWVIDEVRVRREALERDKNGLPQIPGVVIEEEASMSSLS